MMNSLATGLKKHGPDQMITNNTSHFSIYKEGKSSSSHKKKLSCPAFLKGLYNSLFLNLTVSSNKIPTEEKDK